MTTMLKAYDFTTVEDRLYKWWEENGWFKPECRPDDAEPFTIAIPPPNVTGQLHMGHAMFVSLEDLMIRRARMQGKAALWIPGTDHAGIATQLQVEKQLAEHGKTKDDIGREAFLDMTWEWKDRYAGRITKQMRSMGASADWERERFTLDDGLTAAVLEAFVRLHRMGLIYRGARMVNWSPGLQTAVSDLEVEFTPHVGKLYHFKYPLKDGGFIPVATTRPETILGDTAIAVHPDDERYQQFIGKMAIVPHVGREIPVIADEYVKMEFGTGALKITPGHDQNDYVIGERHGLPIINVMNKNATINVNGGDYNGMDRYAARERMWAELTAAGHAIEAKEYEHEVPVSQRGGEIIEPLVSKQWFVDAEPMAKMALEAVRSGRINIVPERFNKTWESWLTDIRPWCISRQLWWGHRIPVWYVNGDESQFVVAKSDEEALAIAQKKYGDDVTIERDPDVLDTWFSSGLWPFSTLGWPDDTPDLRRFYPTTVMETGYDILFFWVARMAMQGLMYTNDIPFETIYLHGLVRDEKGKKMSKTKGNVTDPLDVTAQFGTDALRFTLLTSGSPGNDMNLSIPKIESNRNFANKLWNTARFIVSNIPSEDALDPYQGLLAQPEIEHTAADKWILTRLAETTASVNRLMDGFQFGEAGRQLEKLLWDDFADWYIEAAKVQLRSNEKTAWGTLHTLFTVLDAALRMLHPYIPFVTEEVWQQLKAAFEQADLGIEPAEGWSEALIIAQWPEAQATFEAEAGQFGRLQELTTAIRASRAEYKVPPGKRIPAMVVTADPAWLTANKAVFCALARLDQDAIEIVTAADAPDNAVTISLGDYSCYLPLAGMVDLAQEKARLEKEAAELDSQIKRLTGLLNSPFAKKAPENVVQAERDKLALLEASREEIGGRLKTM